MTDKTAAEKPDEKEDLVEIEVEAEDDAGAQAPAEGAPAEAAAADKPAEAAAPEGDAKPGEPDDEDDDEDDDEEDERLSAEQRQEKRRSAGRRRSERRRWAAEQLRQQAQQAELRAARAELLARKAELNMAVFQAQSQSQQIDQQAASLQREYQRWQREKAQAINQNDGNKATQADYQLSQIQQRYAQLNEQKLRASEALQGLGAQAQELQEYERQVAEAFSNGGAAQAQAQPEPPQINSDGQKLAKAFMEAIPWYKPGTKVGDSAIVDTIDVVLMRDGFNPNTKEYWDEFKTRLKAALPARFQQPKNPSPPVGGGRDTMSVAKTKMRIPREAMDTMRQAGIIDEYNKVTDQKKFNNYLARFKANMQAAQRAS